MRVLMAAGGTAGHVNPALSIAAGLEQRYPGSEIHFAGRREGMEYRLVNAKGYEFHHIEVHGIQRNFGPKNIARNASAAWHLMFAPAASAKILKEVKPDIVIGAGGYVSGPVLREAARRGYKTAIHEQNAYPGVTNKILAKSVDLVFAPNQSAVDRMAKPEKSVICGNPVRAEFFAQDRQAARAALNAGDKTVILSFGGSNGAMRINEMMAGLARWHLENRDFIHIHATGKIEKEDFTKLACEQGIDNNKNFIIKEYIDNIAELESAADLIISRAGAGTLAEISAVGRASVLIPSPNVAENHQYYNALEYEKAGAAVVYEEKDLSLEKLIETVDCLTADKSRLEEMGKAAKSLAKPQALDIILDAIDELILNER